MTSSPPSVTDAAGAVLRGSTVSAKSVGSLQFARPLQTVSETRYAPGVSATIPSAARRSPPVVAEIVSRP